MTYSVITTPVFDKWLEGVKDPLARVAVVSRVDRLKDGLLGDASPVGDGYTELRIHTGKGYRVYIKRSGLTIYVVLHGGTKKTQQADINEAKKIGREYGL